MTNRHDVKLWRYLLVVAWMLVIFRFSGEVGDASGGRSDAIVRWLQDLGVPGSFDLLGLLVRKAAHATVYAVLAVLTFLALRGQLERRGALVGSLAISAVYAVSDEVHQLFVPGRTGSARDVENGVDRGPIWMPQLSAVKNAAAEASLRAVEQAVRACGGSSYFNRSELSRLYRDVVAGLFQPSDQESLHSAWANAMLGPVTD